MELLLKAGAIFAVRVINTVCEGNAQDIQHYIREQPDRLTYSPHRIQSRPPLCP